MKQLEAADESTIRGWLLDIRVRNIVWAHYVHDLIHRGLIRFDPSAERYVLTVKGEKMLATSGG